MRVGVKVGPVYLSSSSRRRRSAPRVTQAQLAAQAHQRAANAQRLRLARAERHAKYGPVTLTDPRTWHTPHTIAAIIAVLIIAALPTMLGDGSTTQGVWDVAVLAGLIAWAISIRQTHAAQAPARQAAHEARVHAENLRVQAAQQAAQAHAQYLAPRPVGNAWNHGACTINHRTPDAAYRCRKGGT